MKFFFVLGLVLLVHGDISCNKGNRLGGTCSFNDATSPGCLYNGAAQVLCGRPYIEQSFDVPTFVRRVTFQTDKTAVVNNPRINILVSYNPDDGYVDVADLGAVVSPQYLLPTEGNVYTVTFSKAVPAKYIRIFLSTLDQGAQVKITPIYHTCPGAPSVPQIVWEGDLNESPVYSLTALDFAWAASSPSFLDTEKDVVASIQGRSSILSTTSGTPVIAVCQFKVDNENQCPSETYVTKEFNSQSGAFDGASLGGSYFVYSPPLNLCNNRKYCQVVTSKVFGSNSEARTWCQTGFKDQFKLLTSSVTLFTPRNTKNLDRLTATESSNFKLKNPTVTAGAYTIGLSVPDVFRGSYPRCIATSDSSVTLSCRNGYTISSVASALQVTGSSSSWVDCDAILSSRLSDRQSIVLTGFPQILPIGVTASTDRLLSVQNSCNGKKSCTVTNGGQLFLSYICVPDFPTSDCLGVPSDNLPSYRLSPAQVSISQTQVSYQGAAFTAPTAIITDAQDPDTEVLTVQISVSSSAVTALAVDTPTGGTRSQLSSGVQLVGSRAALNIVLANVRITVNAQCTTTFTYTVSVNDNGAVATAVSTLTTTNIVITSTGSLLATPSTPFQTNQGADLALPAFTLNGLCGSSYTVTYTLTQTGTGLFKLANGVSGTSVQTQSTSTVVTYQPPATFYGSAVFQVIVTAAGQTITLPSLSITVIRRKESPTVAVNTVDNCKEDTPCTFRIKVSDADGVTGDSFQVQVTSTSSSCLVNGLPSTITATLDTPSDVIVTFASHFSTEKGVGPTSCSIRVSVTDKDNLSGSTSLTYTVLEQPDLAANNGVADFTTIETASSVNVPTFTVADDGDPTLDTYTLTVSVGEGTISSSATCSGSGSSQLVFTGIKRADINVLGGRITYKPVRNGSPQTTWSVAILEHRGGATQRAEKKITVTQVNDDPSVDVSNGKPVNEGQAASFVTPSGGSCISVSDPENDKVTVTIRGLLNGNTFGTINGVSTFSITGLPSEVNAALPSVAWIGPAFWCGTITIEVSVVDVPKYTPSCVKQTKTFTIPILAVNNPTTLDANPDGIVGYNGATTVKFTASDPDASSCNPDTYSFTCTTQNNQGTDVIAVFNNKQRTYSQTGLTLSNLNTILGNLYVTHSGILVHASFKVTCAVTSSGDSATVSKTITTTVVGSVSDPSNKAPSVAVATSQTSYNEGWSYTQGKVDIPFTVTITDKDSDYLKTISAEVNFPSNSDSLYSLTGPFINSVQASTSNVLIAPSFTYTVTYIVTPSPHFVGTFKLRVRATDDESTPLTGEAYSQLITIVDVNDPPTVQFVDAVNGLSSSGFSLNEDSSVPFPFAALADVDSTSGFLRLGFPSGQTSLTWKCNSAVVVSGVTCSPGSIGVLSGPIDKINQASAAGILQLSTAINNYFTPSGVGLSVTAVAQDSQGAWSQTKTLTGIRIISVDDPSDITQSPQSVWTNEDTSVQLYGVIVVDPDSNTYASVTLTGAASCASTLRTGTTTPVIIPCGQSYNLGPLSPADVTNAINSLSYLPSQDYNGNSESIVVRVSSGGDLSKPDDNVTISLIVRPVNDAPVIKSLPAVLPGDSDILPTAPLTYSFDVYDVDDENLQVTVEPLSISSPAITYQYFVYGTLSVAGGNAIVSNPNGGSAALNFVPVKRGTTTIAWDRRFHGSLQFKLTVRDPAGLQDARSSTVTVKFANQVPTCSAKTLGLTLLENGPSGIVAWDVDDKDLPDALAATFSVSPIACGTLSSTSFPLIDVASAKRIFSGSDSTSAIRLTPGLDYFGPCNVTATFNDKSGATATATVNATIQFVNYLPTISPTAATISMFEDIPATLPSFNVGDRNVEDLWLNVSFSSANGWVNITDPSITFARDATFTNVTGPKATISSIFAKSQFVPTKDYWGIATITIVVIDPQLARSQQATITVTIAQVDDAPVLVFDGTPTTATGNEDTQINLPKLKNNNNEISALQKLFIITGTAANGTVFPGTTIWGRACPVTGTGSGIGFYDAATVLQSMKYLPLANYNGGDNVTITLRYAQCNACDGRTASECTDAFRAQQCQSSINITVRINSIGDAPVITYGWPTSFIVSYKDPVMYTGTFAFTDDDLSWGADKDSFSLAISCGPVNCGLTTSTGSLYSNQSGLNVAQVIAAASNLQFPAYPSNPPTFIFVRITDSFGLSNTSNISVTYIPRPPAPPAWSPTLTAQTANGTDDSSGQAILSGLFTNAPRVANPDQPNLSLTVKFVLPAGYTANQGQVDATNTYTLTGKASDINALIAALTIRIPATTALTVTFNVPFTIFYLSSQISNTVAVTVNFVNQPPKLVCLSPRGDANCQRIRTPEDTLTLANVYSVTNRERDEIIQLTITSSRAQFSPLSSASLSQTNQLPVLTASGTASAITAIINSVTLINPLNAVYTHNLTFTIADSAGSTVPGNPVTTVEVFDVPDLPAWGPQSYPQLLSGTEDTPISFMIDAADVDTSLLTVTLTSPSGSFSRNGGSFASPLVFNTSDLSKDALVFLPKEDYFCYMENTVQIRVAEALAPFSGASGAAGFISVTIPLTVARVPPTVSFTVNNTAATAVAVREGRTGSFGVVLGAVDGYIELVMTPSCGVLSDTVGSSIGNGGWRIVGQAQVVQQAAASVSWAVPLTAVSSGLCTGISAQVTDGGKTTTATLLSTPVAQCLTGETGVCDDGNAQTLRDRCVNGQCVGYACTQKITPLPQPPTVVASEKSFDFFATDISLVDRRIVNGQTVFTYAVNRVGYAATGLTLGLGFGSRSSFTFGGVLASRTTGSTSAFDQCPNTGINGIRFQPFRSTDVSGTFTISVLGEVLTGKINIGIFASGVYGIGVIDGPVDVCCKDNAITVAQQSNIQTMYICENVQGAVPACPAGQVLRIISSVYGRIIGSPGDAQCGGPVAMKSTDTCALDVTPQTQRSCNGLQGPVPHTPSNWMTGTYNDPCVNTYKYTTLTYTCEGFRNIQQSAIDIQCPSGESIVVNEAVGLRLSSLSCNVPITSTIKSRCDGQTRCTFNSADYAVPCTGWATATDRQVRVKYACSGDTFRSTSEKLNLGRKSCSPGQQHPYFLELSEESDNDEKREFWFDATKLFRSSGAIPVGGTQIVGTGKQQVWKTRDTSAAPLSSRNVNTYYSTSVCVDAATTLRATVGCHPTGYVNAYLRSGNVFKFYGEGVAGTIPVQAGCQTVLFEVGCKGNPFRLSWDKLVYTDYDMVPSQITITDAKASVSLVYESFYIDQSAIIAVQNNNNLYRSTLLNFKSRPQPAGYCTQQISAWANLNNQGVCNGGSATNIGWVWTYTLFEPVGATWEFRWGLDTGLGYLVYVNGNYLASFYGDTWWSYDWNAGLNSGSVYLAGPQTHTITVYAAEGCCDGGSETQFRRAGGNWQTMTVTALQTIVDTVGITNSPPIAFDSCSGSEILVPPAPTPPPTVDVTYGLCQTRTKIDCVAGRSDYTISECDLGGSGRQSVDLFCKAGMGIFLTNVTFGFVSGEPQCTTPSSVHTTTLLADDAKVRSSLWYCHGRNSCKFVIAGIRSVLGWTNANGRVRLSYRCVQPAKCTTSTTKFMKDDDPDCNNGKGNNKNNKLIAQQAVNSRTCTSNALGNGNGNSENSRRDVTVELLSSFSSSARSEFRYRLNLLSSTEAPGGNGGGWGNNRFVSILSLGACGCTGHSTSLPAATSNPSGNTGLNGDGIHISFDSATQSREVVITYNREVGVVNGPWAARLRNGFVQGTVLVPCCDKNECFPNTPLADTVLPSDPSFYSLRFNSYNYVYSSSIGRSETAFVNSVKQALQTSNYCSKDLASHTGISNQAVCSGSSQSIAFKFDHDFYEPSQTGNWQFRFGIDWGYGGFCYLDDHIFNPTTQTWGTNILSIFFQDYNYDLWWAGSWSSSAVFRTSNVTVRTGRHRITCYAVEPCCDGAQAIQYSRNGESWRDLSKANLANTVLNADTKPCADTCGCGEASCRQNPKCIWNGVLCSPIVPTGTCAYASALPPNNPSNPYVQITYNSRYFVGDNNLWVSGSDSFASRVTAALATPVTNGYCSNRVTDLSGFTNQRLCGSSTNIATRIEVLFFEAAGATWGFRFGIDWGWGGVCYLDNQRFWIVRPGASDLWWGGSDWTNPMVQVTNGIVLTPGVHNFSCIFAEPCCDGNQVFQYNRNSAGWKTLTADQLTQEAAFCQPDNQCVESEFTDCSSQIVKVTYQSSLAAFSASTFAATISAQLGVPITSISVVSVIQTPQSTKKKFGIQEETADVMFRIVGTSNETLHDVATKLQEAPRLIKEGDQSSTLLTTAAFLVQPTQASAFQGAMVTVIVTDDSDVVTMGSATNDGVKIAVIVISVIGVLILWAILMVLIMWRRAKVMIISRDPRLLRKTPVYQDIVKQQIV